MMLEFNIRNQEISRIDNFSPAEKSVEYLIAKFNFKTEDWNEAIKRAIFRNVKSKQEKDTMLEDDSCIVPWEVLAGSGDIEVSVHGVIGTEEITTNVAVFNLNRTLQGGSATQEPSPTVYEQMVEMVKDAKEVAQSVRTDADNGKFKGKDGKDGEKGAKGDDGKSAYQYAVEGGFEGTEEEFTELIAQAGQVDLTGFITKEEHEAELLKTMVKVTTDKAPFHHITDSANMKVLDFGMEGKTEQKTTEGKNLFDVDDFKACETLSLLGSGAHWGYKLNVVAGQTYTFNRNNSDGYNVEGLVTSRIADGSGIMIAPLLNKWTESENKANVSFTAADETYLAFNAGNTVSKIQELFDTYFINPQLELGSVATDYEPFTNGPTPNPDFPQEIVNAGVYNEETGRYEHKCCAGNKNWFDESKLSNGEFVEFNGVRCYKYTDGKASTITYDGFFALNTQYTITIRIYRESDDVTKNSYLVAEYTDGTSQDIKCVPNETTIFTSPTDKSIKRITSLPYYGLPAYLDLSVMQIEVDTSATAHVQHASQPFTLTSPVPITKWDKLVKRDGVWGWSIWNEKNVLSASKLTMVSYKGNTSCCVNFNVPNGKHLAQIVSNRVIRGNTASDTDVNCTRIYNGQLQVRLAYPEGITKDSTNVEIMDAYKSVVEETEFIFYYETAEEQAFIPLPDEEQELLRNLEMYYGVTNIYNEQGCPIWLTYVNDTKLYVDKKLLEIQQAII